MAYAELHARTYFSFLDGACAPEDLVTRARELGYGALAVTDVDGLYGVPRAHAAARTLGLSLIIGAEVSVALTESEALLRHRRRGTRAWCSWPRTPAAMRALSDPRRGAPASPQGQRLRHLGRGRP